MTEEPSEKEARRARWFKRQQGRDWKCLCGHDRAMHEDATGCGDVIADAVPGAQPEYRQCGCDRYRRRK